MTAAANSTLTFEEVLATVRATAVEREVGRELLVEQVDLLRSLRFGAARLPVELGGEGISLEEQFRRIIELSAADSNLGHIWRGHIAFVETLRLDGFDTERSRVWAERIARGDFVGNAQSERQETFNISTRIDREADGIYLTGTKYYTTGSIYADWIHLAALDRTERVALTVSAHDPGVTSVDDWDGFGQPLTGSGTTTFERVRVDPQDIVPQSEDRARWKYLGSIFQLSLLAVIAGVGQRAHEDVIDYVRPRRRLGGFADEKLPREDPLVQRVVGEVSGAASAARRLILSLARDLDAAIARVNEEGATERFQELEFEVYRAQRVIPELILDAVTRLFEVGGASAVTVGRRLDRHWRNVRTIHSHNPVDQRTRAIGMWELNGELPEFGAPGAAPGAAAQASTPAPAASDAARTAPQQAETVVAR